jgi:hypothetical protein
MAGIVACVGVVGPKRAIEARTDMSAEPEDLPESQQPKISCADSFVTHYCYVFTHEWATLRNRKDVTRLYEPRD